MKIWLDTTNIETVKQAQQLGILFGVTTNPLLIVQSGKSQKKALQDLLDHQPGPVTAQVVASDVQGMVLQGQELNAFSERLIIKIPVTQAGFEAIRILSHKNIPTMATVILHTHQALMAALAGAKYIAPYVSHFERQHQDPWEVLASISQILQNYKFNTEILAASLPDLEHVQRCAELAIPHITIKEPVWKEWITTTTLTQERVDHFTTSWEQANITFL